MADRNVVIYDGAGYEVRKAPAKAPRAEQTLVVQSRDPWAARTAGELSPELAGRVLRPNANLPQVMTVARALLKNEHVAACMRNYVRSVSRLQWSVTPFDEKSAASRKQADEGRRFVQSIPRLTKLLRYWLYGEFYPLSGVGLFWSSDLTRLANWSKIHPSRWTWDYDENRLKLLTRENNWRGESLDENRRAYGIHFADDEPGSVVEQGHWWKTLWLIIMSLASWGAWVRFADEFGDPSLIAILARGEDEETVFAAIEAMGSRARGVLPPGTDLKTLEAQRYGTSALHQAIITMAYKGISKLILGHSLSIDAEGDTGNLAGGHAETVSQQNIEAGADNISETFQSEIFRPWCEWQFGETAIERNEVPVVSILSAPPEDQSKKATTYVTVNQALAPSGRTIAPDQIEAEFEVRTVPIANAPAPTANNETDDEDNEESAASRLTRAVAAMRRPRLATAEQLAAAQRTLIAAGARALSEELLAKVQAASEDGVLDLLWESYADLTGQTAQLASGLRDTTVALHLDAQAEVADEG